MSNEITEAQQENEIIYFRFPFISNKINNLIEDTIKRISKQYFEKVTIRLVFYNNRRTSSIIRLKESLASGMCSMIVYKFVCPKCSMEYIGSTTKLLLTRFFEHKGISQRTLTPLGKPPQSSIREHCESICHTQFDISNFNILHKARYDSELRLFETFLIEKIKPKLNIESSASTKKVF